MDEISPKELETLILLFINERFNQIINSYLKYFDEKWKNATSISVKCFKHFRKQECC